MMLPRGLQMVHGLKDKGNIVFLAWYQVPFDGLFWLLISRKVKSQREKPGLSVKFYEDLLFAQQLLHPVWYIVGSGFEKKDSH